VPEGLLDQLDDIDRLLRKFPHCDLADASVIALSERYRRASVLSLDRRHFITYRRADGSRVPVVSRRLKVPIARWDPITERLSRRCRAPPMGPLSGRNFANALFCSQQAGRANSCQFAGGLNSRRTSVAGRRRTIPTNCRRSDYTFGKETDADNCMLHMQYKTVVVQIVATLCSSTILRYTNVTKNLLCTSSV
jgi:hypothetical protein